MPVWLSGVKSFLFHEPRIFLLNKAKNCVFNVPIKPFSLAVPLLEGDWKQVGMMCVGGAAAGFGLYYVKSQYDNWNKSQHLNNASIIESIIKDANSTNSRLEEVVKKKRKSVELITLPKMQKLSI